jgi:imidazolonepropionase-like amidohydrolase
MTFTEMLRALFTLFVLLPVVLPSGASAQIAVRADTVYTMEGPPIIGGIVLVRGTTIEAVGRASAVRIPAGYQVLEASVVTPGLIDARGTVGLSGILNQPHDQEHMDLSGPLQPELRALDAFAHDEELVGWVRSFGITTVQVGPSPGALSGGQTSVFKTRGRSADADLVSDAPMVQFTVGPSVRGNFQNAGTRARGIALLREALIGAQRYAEQQNGDKAPARNLRNEALARVLSGEAVALITAHQAHDILTALRLAEEFGLRMVLDGGAEAYRVIDELRAAGVPVILHPTMMRAGGEVRNASMETAARLADAGILFAIQSGYEGYVPKTRVVLFEAAIAAANGLDRQRALAAITLDAARILGLESRVGSIAPGKDADLVLFNGDPFEYVTRVCGVLIEGEIVSSSCR